MAKVRCSVCTILCVPMEGKTTCDDKCEAYAKKYCYKAVERNIHTKTEKECERCGKSFMAKLNTARLCSNECKRENHNTAQMKYWQKTQGKQ